MLLLHMQEIVFVNSQEGLLSSRGGGGPDILAPGLQCGACARERTFYQHNSAITTFIGQQIVTPGKNGTSGRPVPNPSGAEVIVSDS